MADNTIANRYLVLGNTYPVKEEIKKLSGARWVKERQCWLTNETGDIPGVAFIPDPLPSGWRITNGLRDTDKKIVKAPLDDKYVFIVAQWTSREFDCDLEQWVETTSSLIRPLSGEEQQELDQQRAASEQKLAARRELRILGSEEAEYPETTLAEIKNAANAFYTFDQDQVAYGGGWWVAICNNCVWVILNNGRDGDLWSDNNVRTGGAGAIGRKLPSAYRQKTEELLAALEAKLHSESTAKEETKTMSISDRIEQAPACEVINLSDAEKNIYNGAGWKIARFQDGQLRELFDPAETLYQDDTAAMTKAALDGALDWMKANSGEYWLVLCSCYQLCEPSPISPTDASALAKFMRVVGEEFADS